ncbi:MAG: hypothetical protein AB8B55_18825 [Mariniblastus sp.]
MSKFKIYILNRFAAKSSIYNSWMSGCPYPCEIVETSAIDWRVPDDAGIVVTHLHYRWEEISALRRIYETTRVPILILTDGILEYRNTWENPNVADGAFFKPLMGHKLACIGRAQARTLESWGNAGKCEVVGMPRLDAAYDEEYLPVQNDGPFRLLVATANTPAFTPEQRSKVIQSIRHLEERIEFGAPVGGREIEVTWRLTDGLHDELALKKQDQDQEQIAEMASVPLSDAIELADAVITTPSTLYLESVMKHRPTAILDYSNSPTYVPSSWTISAPLHMNEVLCELENPPAAKMLFQESVFRDQLEHGNSKSRLYALIHEMIKAGQVARQTQNSIVLPPRILSDPQRGIQKVESNFETSVLFPGNSSFRILEVERLQQELSQAIARLGQLPMELDAKEVDVLAKNRDLERKEVHIQRLSGVLSETEERVEQARLREQAHAEIVASKHADIEKKNAHIESLNQLFNEANATVKALRAELIGQKIQYQESQRRLAVVNNRLNSIQKNQIA